MTRTVLPELTDEIVASFQMEGISTVSDLRRYCVGKQVETFLLEDEVPDTASAFVWQEVAKTARSTATRKKLLILIAKLTEKSGK